MSNIEVRKKRIPKEKRISNIEYRISK